MNIRDLFVPLSLALLTTWAINYFFLRKYRETYPDKTEQTFIAPHEQKSYKPLDKEVDFVDTKRIGKPVHSQVVTDWGEVSFSTDGASLESIDFTRIINGKTHYVRTVFPVSMVEREKRCFLVGLQEMTPYFYKLVEHTDTAESSQLTYSSESPIGTIKKIYTVHKNKHQIDLQIVATPKKDAMQLRLFYPSPVMPEMEKRDITSSIVVDQRDTFTKTRADKLDEQQGWFAPQIFGTDNRYYIHALVADSDHFAYRAYYLQQDKSLVSIIESPEITTKTTWNVSFYFGPKAHTAMMQVDKRLEQTLDYSGLLAPLSKLLLSLLLWLYSYIHNFGLAIILLTMLIKIVLLPLTMRSERGMRQQKDMQKKLAYIQQKYKHDPELLARERAELIRKHGMPGLGGCLLPLLLQFPIFIALNRVLSSSIELYKAPMLWIPDLSGTDPYYIFPLLVMLAMFIQAMYQDKQQRSTTIAMGVGFGAITANLAAGLSLYIATNQLLSVLQSKLMKKLGKK